ncbi:hypothetical protein F5050DRAFT_1721365 [Lentinula boryana]|uniref:Protein kinase domain-containing protein n=1 Tax=Lentinula boryana TaxID=40481 RepID=A0ABQ8QTQ7_9AGAR|nr:hypothetical protein F5050DRAFT_1721365 [Lentinula boryana]
MDVLSTTKDAIELVALLYERYSDYKESDKTIKSIYTRLDGVQVRLELFEEYIFTAKSNLHFRQVRILLKSLENITDILHELLERLPTSINVSKKIAWAAWGKRGVGRLLSDLATWDEETYRTIFTLDMLCQIRGHDSLYQRLFDTGDRSLTATWSLSRRIHSSDDALPISPISLSDIDITYESSTNLSDRFLSTLDSRLVYLEAHYVTNSEKSQKQAIERIAGVFRSPDLPSMHLLSCLGFAENYLPLERCFLVYQIPEPDAEIGKAEGVPTLASALDREVRMSLEDRFRVATEITMAVMEIHAAGWVHKNIRSDNILLFIDEGKKGTKRDARIGTAYLVGFEAARPQVQASDQRPESDLVKRRYHHPERQGGQDTMVEKFDIRYDMYSLGAVLIEIGYRKTLRRIFAARGNQQEEPLPGETEENHKRLVDYGHRLGDKMGSKYANAALTCLTKSTQKGKTTDVLREEFYDDVLLPLKQIFEGFKVKASK